MNETKTTGLFFGVAVVALAIGIFVSRSTGISTANRDPSKERINQPLFPDFKDPGVAASLKVSTFDEVQGQLGAFEVRKNPETGLWTIPSRSGYPADATDQMAAAANALIDLTVLDVQTTNPEDHDDLGVVEPKIEDLEIGDVGVGRLVTFKDESQNPLASLIIGKEKESDGKIYVRVPGQNPVYVVDLDDSPLTTDFQAWIEEDLLQLSSINISEMQIKDYNASVGLQGAAWNRNFTAKVIQDGTEWTVEEILEYDPKDPLADPKSAEIPADATPNKAKFDEVKNALDDLVIVDVLRKPDGMSANLRADKELVSDREAVQSLQGRGFFPMQIQEDGAVEILSANGEMALTLNDGVEYVLRFGDVASVDAGESTEEVTTGANRYLLVTTRLDESQFPVEGLQEIPQTYEQAYAVENPEAAVEAAEKKAAEQAEAAEEMKTEEAGEGKPAVEESETEETKAEEKTEPEAEGESDETEASEEMKEEPAEEKPADDKSDEGEPADKEVSEEKAEDNKPADEPAKDESESEKSDAEGEESGEVKVDGEGEASGTGGGVVPSSDDDTQSADDKADAGADEEDSDAAADPELTEQEKQEYVAAVQEKVGRANQRIMDARSDKMESAKRRVRELNARFADWYYVIPESTYSKLRVKRDELFESEDAATTAAPMPPGGAGFRVVQCCKVFQPLRDNNIRSMEKGAHWQ